MRDRWYGKYRRCHGYGWRSSHRWRTEHGRHSHHGWRAEHGRRSHYGWRAEHGRRSHHGWRAEHGRRSHHGWRAEHGRRSHHGWRTEHRRRSHHGWRTEHRRHKQRCTAGNPSIQLRRQYWHQRNRFHAEPQRRNAHEQRGLVSLWPQWQRSQFCRRGLVSRDADWSARRLSCPHHLGLGPTHGQRCRESSFLLWYGFHASHARAQ
jgi:hypothetical protein